MRALRPLASEDRRDPVRAAWVAAAALSWPAFAGAQAADCACVRNDTGQAVVYEVARGTGAPQTITSEPRSQWRHCIALRDGQEAPPLFLRLDTDPGSGVSTHRFRVPGAATPTQDCARLPEEALHVLVRVGAPERLDLQRRGPPQAPPVDDPDAAAWTRLAPRLAGEAVSPERFADDALRLCRHRLQRQNEAARQVRERWPHAATPVEVEQTRQHLLEGYLTALDEACRGQPEHARRAEFDERREASRRACVAIARSADDCRPRLAW
jgi:hypothetical protein